MIKAVIFDFDQVVINSYPEHVKAFVLSAKDFGVKIKPKDVYARLGEAGVEIMEELTPSMPKKKIRELIENKENIYRQTVAKKGIKLMPGAKGLLVFLRRKKIKCGIASAASKTNILLTLRKTKTKKYFQVVVAAEDVKRHKPHPDALLKAAKALKVKPKDCLYVGDSIFEMMAAQRAKMKGVGLHTGVYSRPKLKKKRAKHVVNKLSQIKGLV